MVIKIKLNIKEFKQINCRLHVIILIEMFLILLNIQ